MNGKKNVVGDRWKKWALLNNEKGDPGRRRVGSKQKSKEGNLRQLSK